MKIILKIFQLLCRVQIFVRAPFYWNPAESATVMTPSRTAELGSFTLRLECFYTLEPIETLSRIVWSRRNSEDRDFIDIATNSGIMFRDLRARARVLLRNQSLNLVFDRVTCRDEAEYRCTLEYVFQQDLSNRIEDQMNLTLIAKPSKPSTLSILPKGSIPESATVSFECSGNVGKPAGDIWWLAYKKDSGQSRVINYTNVARTRALDSASPLCTFHKASMLTIPVFRGDNGIRIRCYTYHPLFNEELSSGCDLSRERCLQTERIGVLYPVRKEDMTIVREPEADVYQTGSSLRLTCRADGNPKPSYSWESVNEDDVNVNETLVLADLDVTDSGVYRCVAKSSILQKEFTAALSVRIRVEVMGSREAGLGVGIPIGVVITLVVVAILISGILIFRYSGRKKRKNRQLTNAVSSPHYAVAYDNRDNHIYYSIESNVPEEEETYQEINDPTISHYQNQGMGTAGNEGSSETDGYIDMTKGPRVYENAKRKRNK